MKILRNAADKLKRHHRTLFAGFCLLLAFFCMGNHADAASKTVKRPSKVTVSSVKLTSKNTVKITWKKAANAKKYEVWYRIGDGSYKKLKTTKSKSVTQKNLKGGKTYVYKVRAVNGKKKGSYSSVKRIYTISTANPGLSITQSGTSATLKWSKITNATGYYIYKKGSNGYTKITSVTDRTFTVSGLQLGTSYTYKVCPYITASNGSRFNGTSSTKTLNVPDQGWLLDYITPYRDSGLISYKQYKSTSFTMSGTSYSHGFTTTGFTDESKAISFSLGGKYASLSFKVGVCDNSGLLWSHYKTGRVSVYGDGKLLKEITVEDETVQTCTLDVKGCSQLKIYVSETILNGNIPTNLKDTRYGFADMKISK